MHLYTFHKCFAPYKTTVNNSTSSSQTIYYFLINKYNITNYIAVLSLLVRSELASLAICTSAVSLGSAYKDVYCTYNVYLAGFPAIYPISKPTSMHPKKWEARKKLAGRTV